METLTYPYGETPEEVIRERLAATNANLSLCTYEDGNAADTNIIQDDLLTGLDALKVASKYGDDGSPYPDTKKAAARQLRISILAALGIEED